MSRFDAISSVLSNIKKEDILIATTGKTARELYLLKKKQNQLQSDLLVVGGMGHASAIALGALEVCNNRRIILLDGDGALLMHMGILSLLGKQKNNIFIHVLLNNEVHDSVGGQKTAISNVNLRLLSKAVKYNFFKNLSTKQEINGYFKSIKKENSSHFLNIKIKVGSETSLPRPEEIPSKNFQLFQKKILNGKKK